MSNTIRVPRPIGSTELGNKYNRTLDETNYQALLQNIIHHYIRNDFSYCQVPMGIETFSGLIGIEVNIVKGYFTSYGKELSKLANEMVNGDMLRALNSKAFFGCLEDRSAVQQQLTLLLQSQGGEYKPFISGEVNRAIKLLMDSTNSMTNLMKAMGGEGTGFGAVNPYQPNQDKGITTDEVVRLLKTENVTPLLSDNEAQDMLFRAYKISEQPEVNALLQTGMDTSKEGLNVNSLTALSDDDLEKLSNKVSRHENRRSNEIGIDQEEDQI
jgi:hypothetical protein